MAVTNLYHTTTWAGPVSAVGAGATLQDGWVDVPGSIWSIDGSNRLTGSGLYNATHLVRPSAENQQDQRLVASLPAAATQSAIVLLRWVDASNTYLLLFNDGGTVQIYKIVGGSLTALTSPSGITYNAAHAYDLDFTCEGISPTTLTVTVTDTTASSVLVNAFSTTDSDAALQASARYGLATNGTALIGTTRLYNTGGAAAVSDAVAACRRPPMHLLAR